MPAIFSRSCEYGIQAVLFLAKNAGNARPIHLRTISDGLNVPHHFLSKILQTLARDEIVVSQKGQNGGFQLGRPASQITMMEIVEAIDGKGFLDRCIFGFAKCQEEQPCPAHRSWKPAKKMIVAMLETKTVEDFSRGLDGKFRLPAAAAGPLRIQASV